MTRSFFAVVERKTKHKSFVIQLAMISRKCQVVSSPASHVYHMANEIPVSNINCLKLLIFTVK